MDWNKVDKIMVDNNIKQWQKSKIAKDGNVPRTFIDDPVEAWKYIEKKYGRF